MRLNIAKKGTFREKRLLVFSLAMLFLVAIIFLIMPKKERTELSMLARGSSPRISSDGARIVFYKEEPYNERGIWIMDSTGKNKKALLIRKVYRKRSPNGDIYFSGEDYRKPVFSPDGKEIAFIQLTYHKTGTDSNVGILKLTGGRKELVTHYKNSIKLPYIIKGLSFSPDGARIFFTQHYDVYPKYFKDRLIELNLATGEEKEIASFSSNVSFSPVFVANGKKIVFGTKKGDKDKLWIMDLGNRQKRLIWQGINYSYTDDLSVSPDENKIVFSICNYPQDVGVENVLVAEINTKKVTQLTHARIGGYGYPVFGPNGEKVLFTSFPSYNELEGYVGPPEAINIMRVGNNKIRILIRNKERKTYQDLAFFPGWKKILFTECGAAGGGTCKIMEARISDYLEN